MFELLLHMIIAFVFLTMTNLLAILIWLKQKKSKEMISTHHGKTNENHVIDLPEILSECSQKL